VGWGACSGPVPECVGRGADLGGDVHDQGREPWAGPGEGRRTCGRSAENHAAVETQERDGDNAGGGAGRPGRLRRREGTTEGRCPTESGEREEGRSREREG